MNTIWLPGFCLFSILLLLFTYSVKFVPRNGSLYILRICFALSLWLFTFFDFIFYAMQSFGKNDDTHRWPFAFHLVSLCFEVFAFSFVILLWSIQILGSTKNIYLIALLLALFDGSYAICILVGLVSLLQTKKDVDDWLEEEDYSHYLYLIQSINLFFNSACVLVFCFFIFKNLLSHPRWETLTRSEQRSLLSRLFLTMSLCSLCFFGRSFFNFVQFMRWVDAFENLHWYILAQSVTTIIPALLLFIIVNRKNTQKPTKNVPAYLNSLTVSTDYPDSLAFHLLLPINDDDYGTIF